MTSLPLSSSSSPLDQVIAELDQALGARFEAGSKTLAAAVEGGLQKLMLMMTLAGWQLAGEPDLAFDFSSGLDGSEVLLARCTRPSESGEWGLLWRSEWDLR
jgi:hypothetical protein